jgi:tryptophan synthase alpha chain
LFQILNFAVDKYFMNRIDQVFKSKEKKLLNVYFTAGYPHLNETVRILVSLQNAGVDLIEIGMPYSDPVADGETIQASNQKALENGMSLKILFEQLAGIREKGVTLPILLMGYFNPVYQFGVEDFCRKCAEIGIDGLILPDLPFDEYFLNYKVLFEKYGLHNIFLITPQTTEERIRKIDAVSSGFIYMVSSASVTGKTSGISKDMIQYFDRVNAMNLKNPRLIGFGIKDKDSFLEASKYASGAIIGSQFVRVVSDSGDLEANINQFIKSII